MAQQPVMQNRVEQGLLSTSDVVQVDSIELQDIMEDAARSTEDLTSQFDNPQGDSLVYPLCELLGMEKELRSSGGSLKVETVKKVELEEYIGRGKSANSWKSRTTQNMTMAFEKTLGIGSKG